MSRLQQETERTIDIMTEAKIGTVITLLEKGVIQGTRSIRIEALEILVEHFNIPEEEANCWLDWLRV